MGCLVLRGVPDRYDAEIMVPSEEQQGVGSLGMRELQRRQYRLGVAGALIAGAALRVWFILAYSHITGDTLVYGDIAINWLRHGVYGFSQTIHGLPAPPRPTLIRLPGYPLFLALCFQVFRGERYGAVLFLQGVLDLGTCGLISATAARVFGGRAGLTALWLAALCPFSAIYVAFPLTETLTLLCIALAFYALLRWALVPAPINRWIWVLGFALAYAILLRPEQGMLAACVVPAMIWIGWKRRGDFVSALRPAAVVSLLTLLPLVPWTIRNERTFHLLQPLAPRFANDPGETNPYGFQRWYRTWAIDYASTETIYWNYEGAEIQIADLPERAFDSPAQYGATEAIFDEYNERTSSTPELDRRFDELAVARIQAEPLRYFVLLPLARVLNMIFRPRAEAFPLPLDWWRFRQHWFNSLVATLLGTINLGYIVFAATGFWNRRSLATDYELVAPILWSMASTIALRCLLLLTLDNSETRYTLEFFPVLILFAAGWIGPRTATFRRPWRVRA